MICAEAKLIVPASCIYLTHMASMPGNVGPVALHVFDVIATALA